MVFNQIRVEAFADTQIQYYDRDAGKTQSVSAKVLDSSVTDWNLSTGWYVVKGTFEINVRIKVNGSVHLILENRAKLTANEGIEVSEGNSLTIYGQSEEVTGDTGNLVATVTGENAGIGGNASSAGGKITITGGKIEASSANEGASIGGGNGGAGGKITITGGKVMASSADEGAGIGGGKDGAGGSINITGGEVEARANHGAGIGGGNQGAAGSITITGGKITASSEYDGAGIGSGNEGTGGSITITGGEVTASSAYYGAGIGGGRSRAVESINITGGKIEASSQSGAGIGGGYQGAGESINIAGGDVKASSQPGAGIGGGDRGAAGSITITGGIIEAKSTSQGAGIGSGNEGEKGDITIKGGKVTANSDWGAGIGGGYDKEGGTINITGGEVTASSNNGAGIGGGKDGAGGKITIKGGKVEASSNRGAGIGGGASEAGGSVKIKGGKVEASSNDGAGIGSGADVIGGATGTFSTEPDGKAIIEASSISDNNIKTNWKGIIFEGNNGSVYGNQELSEDFEIKTGKTLTVPGNTEFTVPVGKTLTISGTLKNKGIIKNFGKITGSIQTEENGKLLAAYSKPVASIDYSSEKLTGFAHGVSYQITLDGDGATTIEKQNSGEIKIKPDWFGKTLSIKAKEDETHLESPAQDLSINDRPDAPAGLQGVNETATDKKDGKITGTMTEMQYSISIPVEWKPCTGNEITGLAPGKYLVRYIAAADKFASKTAEIEIKKFQTGNTGNSGSGSSGSGSNSSANSGGRASTPSVVLNEGNNGQTANNTKADTDKKTEDSKTESNHSKTDGSVGVPDTDKGSSSPVKAEIKILATKGKNKTAAAKISEKMVEEAINKVKEDVKENGKEIVGISLGIKVDLPKGTNKVKVNLTEGALGKIISEEVNSLAIDNSLSNMVFDKAVLSEIKKHSKGSITLTTFLNKKLSKKVKKLVGKRPAYDLSISYLNGKKKITRLGKGNIKISLPYNLKENEKADGLYAFYIDRKGKVRKIKGSYYDKESGAMVFSTKKLAVFGTGYTEK